MSRLLNLYRTQFRILREWRGGRWSLVKRMIVAPISFVLTTRIMPGLLQATLVVAIQVIVTSVHATVAVPGSVATNITTNSGVAIPNMKPGTKMPKVLAADKAARIILDGMEKDTYRVLVGSDAKLMDRLYRIHPRRAAGIIAGRMKDLLG